MRSLRLLFLLFLYVIAFISCSVNNVKKANLKERTGIFIIHDDFTNLLFDPDTTLPKSEILKNSAKRFAQSGADYISLCVSLGDVVNYSPAKEAETIMETSTGVWKADQVNVDPYGIAVQEITGTGIPVLAKFRVNDRHHVAGGRDYLAGSFWKEHPEWRIGNNENDSMILEYFRHNASVHPTALGVIIKDRPKLLDYSIAEVRKKRLSIFREVLERYDVVGATLNFLREPYCISNPQENGRYLTEFVRCCRELTDEILNKRGVHSPVLGALLPWDIEFCKAMGMEVEIWIKDGLLDYVSPSEGWVTDLNADIKPWIEIARGSQCAVLPSIIGMIGFNADFCYADEYNREGRRINSAKIMPSNIRAYAHRLYSEGATGMSSFNLYGSEYNYLFPLSALIEPSNVENNERVYIFLKEPGYIQWNFMQLKIPAGSLDRVKMDCILYEAPADGKAILRFKVRGLTRKDNLSLDINGHNIDTQKILLIPYEDASCMELQYPIAADELQDGSNQLIFSLKKMIPAPVIIQEIEITIQP